jgi:hypothetical protein
MRGEQYRSAVVDCSKPSGVRGPALARFVGFNHAHHWAGIVLAVLILSIVVTQFLQDQSLAKRGLRATAIVLGYDPQRPPYRGGGYTRHDHYLAFAGYVERVELAHMRAPGSQVPIIFLPDKPAVVVEVGADTRPADLLSLPTLWRCGVFTLGGLLLLAWGIRGLLTGRIDAPETTPPR